MSTTDVYRLYKTKVTTVSEHKNSWHSAPVVWNALADKYLGTKRPMVDVNAMEAVWNLDEDPRLSLPERFVLLMTFDHAFCETDHLLRGAELIRDWVEASNTYDSHWPAIARDFVSVEQNPDHRLRGVCIRHSSVGEHWNWSNFKQEAEPAWGVFESLKADGYLTCMQ